MSATSRELVWNTLRGENHGRAPRQMWLLPIAENRYADEIASIQRDYPSDFINVDAQYSQTAPTHGDWFRIGEYVDEWGCTFVNVQNGVIGEVKDPLVKDWVTDRAKIHIPREWLTINREAINRQCAATDKFTFAGANVRPFEQLQFLRGSENLYMDLLDLPTEMQEFWREMHAFYCELFMVWAKTDVDALVFLDDWGSQRSLLISPTLWRDLFKPLYRDYIQIAHAAGKKVFMHSDGHILAIFPDLIELGLDAVNSQLFCMGVDKLVPFAGQITFWGEIDRQHLLPNATTAEIDAAVRNVHAALWRNGGCIAQCEFGPAAKPENVRQVFASWNAATE